MKKLIISSLLLGLTVRCTAAEQKTLWIDPAGCQMAVATDTDTDVQCTVVTFLQGISITPRFAEDGEPYVCG